eukprot:3006807-Pleurochrysis_carterae.AAC.1
MTVPEPLALRPRACLVWLAPQREADAVTQANASQRHEGRRHVLNAQVRRRRALALIAGQHIGHNLAQPHCLALAAGLLVPPVARPLPPASRPPPKLPHPPPSSDAPRRARPLPDSTTYSRRRPGGWRYLHREHCCSPILHAWPPAPQLSAPARPLHLSEHPRAQTRASTSCVNRAQ